MTDFLASNNISAAQIQADYESRRRQAQQQEEQTSHVDPSADQENEEPLAVNRAASPKKRKRDQEQALTKIKKSKQNSKGKRSKKALADADGDDDYGISVDMYTKKQPLPGQLENCEQCAARFTVTAYSKTGPDGGLLCRACSKEQEADRKKEVSAQKLNKNREKRRNVQSNLLDGAVSIGSKTLLEQCIKVGRLHNVFVFQHSQFRYR